MTVGFFKLTSQKALTFVLLSYALVLAPFVSESNRNYLVLFAGLVSLPLLFAFRVKLTRAILLWMLLTALMVASVLVYDPVDQLASVALTAVYASGYFLVAALFERVPNKREYIRKILILIITLFAAISVIQMVASLAGLPVPNKMATKGIWSYNSFAMEPSHLGRVIGITMLAYLIVIRPAGRPEFLSRQFLRERKAFLSFITTMLLSGSALAAAAIPITIILSRSLRWGMAIFIVVQLAWPIITLVDYEPLNRAFAIASNLNSLNIDTLVEADQSGAGRIVPFIIYFQEVTPADAAFWFGFGADGPTQLLSGRIPGFGDKTAAGFIPGFMIVYGVLLSALFMWIFLFRYTNRATVPVIIYWLLFITTSAYNTQVLWYGLIMVYIVWSIQKENFNTSRGVPV